MTSYNASNSLSPMMFKKAKGSRDDNRRTKSMENVNDLGLPSSIVKLGNKFRRGSNSGAVEKVRCEMGWREISSVKAHSPVVTCLLPALSMDFVASSLLAVGATPLIAEGTMLRC